MKAYMRMYPKGIHTQASNERVTRFSQAGVYEGVTMCCMILNKKDQGEGY